MNEKTSTIDDLQALCYTKVKKFTITSKAESGHSSSSGNYLKVERNAELSYFDGVLVRDGVLGNSNVTICRRFQKGSCYYSKDIDDAMIATRCSQLKLLLKLCHSVSAPKRGDSGYDLAHKCSLIFKTIVHNCNIIIKHAHQHQVIDGSTKEHSCYGEASSG